MSGRGRRRGSGRGSVALVLGAMVACAEWAGPGPGGPTLAIVPLFGEPTAVAAGALVNDLDRIRVVVRQLPAGSLVADTSVAVDTEGNARVTVPVFLMGASQALFEVALEGIRSSDAMVLYTGIDTVLVTSSTPTPPESIVATYVGPCSLGAGCRVAVGPQNATLKQAESVMLTIVVDSLGVTVPNVPVRVTNITPGLVTLTGGPAVTALSGTSCGPARIAVSIQLT